MAILSVPVFSAKQIIDAFFKGVVCFIAEYVGLDWMQSTLLWH